jgi:transposase, IS5 family
MTLLSLLLESPLLRITTPPLTLWDDLLPDQATRLPDELTRIDAYLDDERFLVPWHDHFSATLGRPSVPVPTVLRLLYLKHRYQLGYQTLCREVADSISWRRFCRIPPDQPVPHPTTLSKLVRRCGPGPIAALNAALLTKLAADKLVHCRKLRVDTTVVEADIDFPTDADLLEQAVRTVGGLVRRRKARGAARRTAFRDRSRSAGRRMRQLAQTLRRRTGLAMGEVDRLTGEVAMIARRTLGEVADVQRAAHHAVARRPRDGWLRRLTSQLAQTVQLTQRLLAQTTQRLAGNRAIPDRVVSLADPDARPIRRGKPRSPTQFGSTLLLAEDERGFVADHQLHKGNPPDAHSCSRRCTASLPSEAGRPAPWSPTAASGWPPTTAPSLSSACGGSGCNAPAPRARAGGRWNTTRAFKRLRNWRVGIEARISHLKRSFGLRRTRLRRLSGARTWVGLGIFAYNLQRMTVVTG